MTVVLSMSLRDVNISFIKRADTDRYISVFHRHISMSGQKRLASMYTDILPKQLTFLDRYCKYHKKIGKYWYLSNVR